MAWHVKRISNSKDRVSEAVRRALEDAALADKSGGQVYRTVATAVEQSIQAFVNINGHSIEVETSGDIQANGSGYLTISVRTIDRDVIV